MEIKRIVDEAEIVAYEYGLKVLGIDQTENIISLKLIIDNEFFIQVYGNVKKNKLNLALVFKKRRLYGYDSEGGQYHCHPFDDPDGHIFVNTKKSIKEFVSESMKFLEEKNLL